MGIVPVPWAGPFSARGSCCVMTPSDWGLLTLGHGAIPGMEANRGPISRDRYPQIALGCGTRSALEVCPASRLRLSAPDCPAKPQAACGTDNPGNVKGRHLMNDRSLGGSASLCLLLGGLTLGCGQRQSQ